MNYHAPSNCPVCGQTMEVTRLHCRHCQTELTGRFAPCRFCLLEDRHRQFVEAFLRCRGSIKDVEKLLGVSYPTVKNMMEAALEALGLTGPDSALPAAGKRLKEEEKAEILEKLSKKEIDVNSAIRALEGEKGEDDE